MLWHFIDQKHYSRGNYVSDFYEAAISLKSLKSPKPSSFTDLLYDSRVSGTQHSLRMIKERCDTLTGITGELIFVLELGQIINLNWLKLQAIQCWEIQDKHLNSSKRIVLAQLMQKYT